MTTSRDIEAFISSNAAQAIITKGFRNINEIYVADKLGVTRSQARAALKLAGRW